jgi:hypothetical protein
MNDMVRVEDPRVQVVFPQGDNRAFLLSDIMLEGDNPATISDTEMIARSARWLDRPVGDFAGMVVTRPRTGNVLIAPKPVYGGDITEAIGAGVLVVLGVALLVLATPLITAAVGYLTGWILSTVFPFAGLWILDGADHFGLNWSLASLPMIGAFIGFVAGFFRRSITVKHEKK